MKKLHLYILGTSLIIIFLVIFIRYLNLKILFSLHYYINDKAFTMKESMEGDTSIVLINAGKADRATTAALVDTLAKVDPAVIGIQICYSEHRNSPHDSLLKASLQKILHLVLLKNDTSGNCISPSGSYSVPTAMLVEKDEVVRSFRSSPETFEGKIVSLYNADKYKTLEERNKTHEIINYTGNTDRFFALDYVDVLQGNFDDDFLKNKILLIGFMGHELSLSQEVKEIESAYYTPLNKKINKSKATPDMYSVVISANILSTILKKNYIEQVPYFISILIILALVIFNLLLGSLIMEKSKILFIAFSILTFFTEVLLSGLLVVWLLTDKNQMLHLKELPVALILGFISTYIINNQLNIRKQKNIEAQKNPQ
jgi:CHASE2 domain-containing sensor protein